MTNNPIARIMFFSTVIIMTFLIFSLIIWRGSVALGFSLKPRTIIFSSLILVALFALGMAISGLPFKIDEIISSVLIGVVYMLIVLIPILLLRDIASHRYKISPITMIIVSVVYIIIGFYFGTNIKITNIPIETNRISRDYKLVFISDLHVDISRNTKFIQKIVDKIKEVKPDFVFIGGDLMNMGNMDYADAFLPFNQLTMPVYATLGNHDNMGNTEAVFEIFKKTSIVPLRNQSITIDGMQIVGIDDKSYRGKKGLPEILKESNIKDNGKYTILISHQPQKLSKLDGYPIDFEFAGHTHKGQFLPMNLLIGLFNDYSYGHYQDGEKNAFVSQGIGTWGAPIRIGTQSELVLISLVKK